MALYPVVPRTRLVAHYIQFCLGPSHAKAFLSLLGEQTRLILTSIDMPMPIDFVLIPINVLSKGFH